MTAPLTATVFTSAPLRALRLRHDLTQDALARRLGVTKEAVSLWELGNHPSLVNLLRVVSLFAVPLGTFFVVIDDTQADREARQAPQRADARPRRGGLGRGSPITRAVAQLERKRGTWITHPGWHIPVGLADFSIALLRNVAADEQLACEARAAYLQSVKKP